MSIFNRAAKKSTVAYVGENIAACYLLVKKYTDRVSSEAYYLAYIMATLVYVEEETIRPDELAKLAHESTSMTEEAALIHASATIASYEICMENDIPSLFYELRTKAEDERGLRNSIKDVLKSGDRHPVYIAINTERFRTLLKEIEERCF